MPLVTVFNLRREDRLSDLEEATGRELTSMPELAINDYEIDLVPVLMPDEFDGEVTRINVDFWERAERTKEALQELATRLAKAFQAVAGEDRRAKVVIRPYDVGRRRMGVSLMARRSARSWRAALPSTIRTAAHVIVTVVDGESEERKEVIGELVAAG